MAENTHALSYHLSRIASESALSAAEHATNHPSSETSLRRVLNQHTVPLKGSDEEIANELRYIMESSMRLLLMMQRRTQNFEL